jgi:hypothetical protein
LPENSVYTKYKKHLQKFLRKVLACLFKVDISKNNCKNKNLITLNGMMKTSALKFELCWGENR